jgi:hypothetical protein
MWTSLEPTARRLVVTALLAGSLGTAVFAFNTTVTTQQGCCLFIATQCIGDPCVTKDACGGNFCCHLRLSTRAPSAPCG